MLHPPFLPQCAVISSPHATVHSPESLLNPEALKQVTADKARVSAQLHALQTKVCQTTQPELACHASISGPIEQEPFSHVVCAVCCCVGSIPGECARRCARGSTRGEPPQRAQAPVRQARHSSASASVREVAQRCGRLAALCGRLP